MVTNSFHFQMWETETCLRNIGESSSLAKCIVAAIRTFNHRKTSDEHHISCRPSPIRATKAKKPLVTGKISRSALDRAVRPLINQKRLNTESARAPACHNEEHVHLNHTPTNAYNRRVISSKFSCLPRFRELETLEDGEDAGCGSQKT